MKKTMIALVSVALAGCGATEHEDIKQWMQEASKDFKGKVPPLPRIEPFPVVAYEAGEIADPFNPKKIEPERKNKAVAGLQPDMERRREPLESYPLETLKMVGTLVQGKRIQALVLADKTLHQVRVGNYLGQNFGVITDILETEVTLKELTQDAAGDWTERKSVLHLQEKGAGK